MRGRRPKPTHLKELDGNPGKRPLNKAEPKPKGDLYAAPEWMSDTQREGWAYAITHAPYGLLKQLDRSILAIWVVAEDLHLPLQSPYLAILNKQAQIMLKAGAELGFSPASRTRVQIANERANPFGWLQNQVNNPDGLLATPDEWWLTDKSEPDEFFD